MPLQRTRQRSPGQPVGGIRNLSRGVFTYQKPLPDVYQHVAIKPALAIIQNPAATAFYSNAFYAPTAFS